MLKRFVLIAALLAVPATVHAASYGPRFGFSSDPDQVVVGGQMMFPEVAENLSFDPSVELGFGDDLTIFSINLDLHYHFAIEGSNWRPYVGGGPTLSFISWDDDDFPGNGDDSETEAGGGLVVGASVPTRGGDRFFGELKVGLGDVPDFKMMVGWNFGR